MLARSLTANGENNELVDVTDRCCEVEIRAAVGEPARQADDLRHGLRRLRRDKHAGRSAGRQLDFCPWKPRPSHANIATKTRHKTKESSTIGGFATSDDQTESNVTDRVASTTSSLAEAYGRQNMP